MKHSIAIDGPAGAGKSTVAQLVARSLDIHYLNTGAMYRALALFSKRQGADFNDEVAVTALLEQAKITVFYEGENQHTVLNGEDVTDLLRSEEISMGASTVSKYTAVRDRLSALQREIALKTPLVLEGRDIGTNVLPDSPHKFYVTASSEQRAKRRLKQLEALGQSGVYEDILADIIARDKQDTERAYKPLKQAEDAVLIDTTFLTVPEAVEAIRSRVEGS